MYLKLRKYIAISGQIFSTCVWSQCKTLIIDTWMQLVELAKACRSWTKKGWALSIVRRKPSKWNVNEVIKAATRHRLVDIFTWIARTFFSFSYRAYQAGAFRISCSRLFRALNARAKAKASPLRRVAVQQPRRVHFNAPSSTLQAALTPHKLINAGMTY